MPTSVLPPVRLRASGRSLRPAWVRRCCASWFLPGSSGRIVYGHRGEVVGYLSFAEIEPNTDDSIVVLTNNPALQPLELTDRLTADW